jgi:hypothetical protein
VLVQEALFSDLRFGPSVVRFDGTVIEVFRGIETFRYHRALVMAQPVEGPDRKGTFRVTLVTREKGAGVYTLTLDQTGLDQVALVLAAVHAAG